jgi:flagellar motility protein MotE (MotC chaperone)
MTKSSPQKAIKPQRINADKARSAVDRLIGRPSKKHRNGTIMLTVAGLVFLLVPARLIDVAETAIEVLGTSQASAQAVQTTPTTATFEAIVQRGIADGSLTPRVPSTSNDLPQTIVSGGQTRGEAGAEFPIELSSDTLERLYREIEQNRRILDERQKTIAAREQAVVTSERILREQATEIDAAREKLSESIGRAVRESEGDITRLVTIYENMRPRDAAPIFEAMDINMAVDIISRIPERKAAAIFSAMNPEGAKTITQAIDRRRSTLRAQPPN